MSDSPYIATEKKVAELTVRVVILAIVLTVLLAMSNAYLALKLGILTSASIPAAIISMGVLRFFKKSTILEHNAVQTAASAGEAVAGGIVYTIPALVIIHYWTHFDYWTNFFIAACGGILGVLFSIPLRQILVHDNALKFPEGRAIAEVLKSNEDKIGIKDIALGGAIGGFIELLQVGFKVVAGSWDYWFVVKHSLMGLGAGFSATMIGAGYLIGSDMAISIFLGAVLSWIFAVPMVSHFYPQIIHQYPPEQAISILWNNQMRYLGIGGMLFAGIWTFFKLIRPLSNSISTSFSGRSFKNSLNYPISRVNKDIPFGFIFFSVALMGVILFFFFQYIFPTEQVGLAHQEGIAVVFCAVLYVLVIGFLFSIITAYFSGMVGVTASPGSSVVIAGMLFAAWLLLTAINHLVPLPLSFEQLQAAEAMTIIIGSVVTGIAAIANDNTQDLKVGQLVGATPWKQQVMLLLGVVISSLVIPPVMQLLFNVYGIAGVMPHPGMDLSQSLPAPVAALMAAITEAVFRHSLPWSMMLIGGAIILGLLFINRVFRLVRWVNVSILGVAMGMYLPISSSVPIFIGGMIAFLVRKRLRRMEYAKEEHILRKQKGTLIACGLVAGAAMMDVLLAIPFSLCHSPDALQVVGPEWKQAGSILGVLSTLLLGWWIRKRVCE